MHTKYIIHSHTYSYTQSITSVPDADQMHPRASHLLFVTFVVSGQQVKRSFSAGASLNTLLECHVISNSQNAQTLKEYDAILFFFYVYPVDVKMS